MNVRNALSHAFDLSTKWEVEKGIDSTIVRITDSQSHRHHSLDELFLRLKYISGHLSSQC